MGSEVFSRALRDMLFLCSNKVLKLLAKEHYKQPQTLVKMYSEGKNVRESFKSRGKQAVSDVAENAAKKVMTGKGRKEGIKRAAPAKTRAPIRGPTKKQKTSLDNYSPKWHGSRR
jgi:hypothetical protein